MERDRFELALKQLGPSDGVLFEQLAAAFVALEYKELRTLAATSGDGGRDGILYSPVDDQAVVFQYSVTSDYATKILRTAKRLRDTTPEARELIYLTNQLIGPSGDDIKRRLRADYRLSLDPRDRSWFLDRVNLHAQTREAAESLARIKVDPLLPKANSSTGLSDLTPDEVREAAFFLELNYGNVDRQKGLTKASFDSLVRAALRDTDSQKRISRSEVIRRVAGMLPAGRNYDALIASSLDRLSKGTIRHWRQKDEFCLSHAEAINIRDRSARLVLLQQSFRQELEANVELGEEFLGEVLSASQRQAAVDLADNVLDRLLLARGRAFADALATNAVSDYQSGSAQLLIGEAMAELGIAPPRKVKDAAVFAVDSIFGVTSEQVKEYLRGKVDSYSLFSLLQATPDVQKTVLKLFSGGAIWVDATLVLPVLAESLLEESDRSFTNLLHAAREANIDLYVTWGVVEELARHMARSLNYLDYLQQQKVWHGTIPFLVIAYVASGESVYSLPGWIETFCGRIQPFDDVAAYLEGFHEIHTRDLKDDMEKASPALKAAVQNIWRTAKERTNRGLPKESVQFLINHDVESYLGIVMRRRGEAASPLGFNSWWLTLDATAYKMHSLLSKRKELGPPPPSPVMSPDFLLRYLELGPMRAQLSDRSRSQLPVFLDISFYEGVSADIMKAVEEVRQQNQGMPPHMLKRKIRDTMNRLKSDRGRIAEGGVALVETEVVTSIVSASRVRPELTTGSDSA